MLMSAVIAVALGLVPVAENGPAQAVKVDARTAAQVGRYVQFTGKDGRTHVRGFDRLGRSYDLTIDRDGQVRGQAGNWDVAFQIRDAA